MKPDDVEREVEEELKKGQVEQLVKLAEGMTLFHDEFREAYSVIKVNGHNEVLRCRSKNFHRYLAYLFYNQQRKPPSNEALNSALGIIEAKAFYDGEQHALHNRVAWHDSAIWYDLSDGEWRAVKITGQGWEIVDNPPILFRRYSHQAPQVEPLQGGSLDLLDRYVNLSGASVELWKFVLCVYLVPDIPHPILHSHGEHGAGKSCLNRVARALVEPSLTPLLSFPRNMAELAQQLSHHYFVPYDNVGTIQPWISDALCRAVTGEGFTKRELYSDDEDVIYRFRRCIGLNGINITATATDLMDRLILFDMNRIEQQNCREEIELLKGFEADQPKILGAMLDALVTAMQIKPNLILENLPRMADFAVWGEAVSQATGKEPNEFLNLYMGNIHGKNEEVVFGHPVASAVMGLMQDRDHWDGTATALLADLGEVAEQLKLDTKDNDWPKAPNSLTRRLKEVVSSLRDVGVNVGLDKPERKQISIDKVCKISSESSEPSNSNDYKGLDIDGTEGGRSAYRQNNVGENIVKKQGVDSTDGIDGILPSLSGAKNDPEDGGWEEL